MPYLAVSTDTGDGAASSPPRPERIAELVSSGRVQHAWLEADWSGAVLVLSAADEVDARAVVDSLPIAQAGLTRFVLTPLVEPSAESSGRSSPVLVRVAPVPPRVRS